MSRKALVLLIVLFAAGVAIRHFPGPSPLAPRPSAIQAVVVEYSAHRTPAIGAVLTDPQLLAFIHEKKIAWHIVDRAAAGPDLDDVQWAIQAASKASTLPAIVVRSGNCLRSSPLPPTAAATIAILQRYTGK